MGQFKPMVKMETTEPSVILKLKKGGTVAHKKMKKGGGCKETGHKMMDGGMPSVVGKPTGGLTSGYGGGYKTGVAPSRPSLAARRQAMMAGMSKKPMPRKKAPVPVVKPPIMPLPINNIMKSGGSSKATGGVVKGQGGYKTGGVVKGNGGGYKTGGVVLGNGGGYKKGGASKKAFANGGSVQNEGKAVSMPQGNKKPSKPVSINKLSGTFKKGGKVGSKALQAQFKKENAPAMKAAKAKLLDKYSPYQKVGGGQVSDSDYDAVMKAEKAGKKSMINKPVKGKEMSEKRYPSGLSDSDIDLIINSKEMQEKLTHNIDKKMGGAVKKFVDGGLAANTVNPSTPYSMGQGGRGIPTPQAMMNRHDYRDYMKAQGKRPDMRAWNQVNRKRGNQPFSPNIDYRPTTSVNPTSGENTPDYSQFLQDIQNMPNIDDGMWNQSYNPTKLNPPSGYYYGPTDELIPVGTTYDEYKANLPGKQPTGSVNPLAAMKRGGKVKKYDGGGDVSLQSPPTSEMRMRKNIKRGLKAVKDIDSNSNGSLLDALTTIPSRAKDLFVIKGPAVTDTKTTVSRTVSPGKKHGGKAGK